MAKANASDTAKPKATKNTTTKATKGTGAPQRILDSVLMMEIKTKDSHVPRKVILSIVVVKPTTFAVTLSNMKKHWLIEYDKNTIRLTAMGRERAHATIMPLTTTRRRRRTWNAGTNSREDSPCGWLQALLDGRAHDRVATASMIGCTNKSTLAVLLSTMKKHRIITYDRTTIQLHDDAFPFGRPNGNDDM
jgi:hypothetical protein